jgi:Tfp pilus assembly protein PilF
MKKHIASVRVSLFARSVALLGIMLMVLSVSACAKDLTLIRQDTLTTEEHMNLGIAYEHNGELELALSEYEIAAKNDPRGDFYAGNLLFQMGRPEESERHYRKAMRAMPDDALVYNNLAWLLFVSDSRLEEAEQLAELAVKKSSAEQFDDSWDTLTQIRMKREQIKQIPSKDALPAALQTQRADENSASATKPAPKPAPKATPKATNTSKKPASGTEKSGTTPKK